MRSPSSLFALSLLPIAAIAGLVACSSTEDADSSAQFATEEELGTAALKILGAKKMEGHRDNTCNQCHDVNQKQMHAWLDEYKSAKSALLARGATADQKLAALRQDRTDANSGFSPMKLGILAAGVYNSDVPEVKAIETAFNAKFGRGAAAKLADFRENVSMPYGATPGQAARYEGAPVNLTAEEFAIVQKYFDAGLPKLEQLIPEAPRPAKCTETTISDELKAHITASKTTGWAAHNSEQRVPMFACATSGDPASCFAQKKDDGTDIFPDSEAVAYGHGWRVAGSKMRILDETPHASSFWSRNSADGRFIAAGGGDLGAFVVDLQKRLDTKGAERREIGVPASYDPSWMPDNGGLLIQGGHGAWGRNGNFRGDDGVAHDGAEDPSTNTGRVTPQDEPIAPNTGNAGENRGGDPEPGEWEGNRGGRGGGGTEYCTQDLFADPATTNITFEERQCSSLNNVSLYQTVGRRLGDNSVSDYFIVNNTFESDDGYGSDTVPTFGESQEITVHVMVSDGSEGKYQIGQSVSVAAPWEGDTMMSASTALTASRIAGEEKQEGYSIRRLTSTLGDNGYTIGAKPVARICLDGGKANFSFDERYLVTHHYLTRADFASDAEFAPYANANGDKPTADIVIVDLLTGEKIKVTHMQPGQLALFPHFRSDGWLYFQVRDRNTQQEYYVASDAVLGRP